MASKASVESTSSAKESNLRSTCTELEQSIKALNRNPATNLEYELLAEHLSLLHDKLHSFSLRQYSKSEISREEVVKIRKHAQEVQDSLREVNLWTDKLTKLWDTRNNGNAASESGSFLYHTVLNALSLGLPGYMMHPESNVESRREKLVKKIDSVVMEAEKRITELIDVLDITQISKNLKDKFRPSFDTPACPFYITFNFERVDDSGEPLTHEGRLFHAVTSMETANDGAKIIAYDGRSEVGKLSVLRALCHNEEVCDLYRDGVCYIEVSCNAGDREIIDALGECVQKFGGRRVARHLEQAANADEAVKLVSIFLVGKRILMVYNPICRRGEHGYRNCGCGAYEYDFLPHLRNLLKYAPLSVLLLSTEDSRPFSHLVDIYVKFNDLSWEFQYHPLSARNHQYEMLSDMKFFSNKRWLILNEEKFKSISTRFKATSISLNDYILFLCIVDEEFHSFAVTQQKCVTSLVLSYEPVILADKLSVPCIHLPRTTSWSEIQDKLTVLDKTDNQIRAELAIAMIMTRFTGKYSCVLDALMQLDVFSFDCVVDYDIPIDRDMMTVLATPKMYGKCIVSLCGLSSHSVKIEQKADSIIAHVVRGIPMEMLSDVDVDVDLDKGEDELVKKLESLKEFSTLNTSTFYEVVEELPSLTKLSHCSHNLQDVDEELLPYQYGCAAEPPHEFGEILKVGESTRTPSVCDLLGTVDKKSRLANLFHCAKKIEPHLAKTGQLHLSALAILLYEKKVVLNSERWSRIIRGKVQVIEKDGIYWTSRFRGKPVETTFEVNFGIVKYGIKAPWEMGTKKEGRVERLSDVCNLLVSGTEYKAKKCLDFGFVRGPDDLWSDEAAIANSIVTILCRFFGLFTGYSAYASRVSNVRCKENLSHPVTTMEADIFLPRHSLWPCQANHSSSSAADERNVSPIPAEYQGLAVVTTPPEIPRRSLSLRFQPNHTPSPPGSTLVATETGTSLESNFI